MKFIVVTIFPEFFESALRTSLLGKAIEKGELSVEFVDPRDYTDDVHRTVDDLTFGGGPGMVMKCDPLVRALEDIQERNQVNRSIDLSPRGRLLTQQRVAEMAGWKTIVLLCGRYEGIDHRVMEGGWIDEELSLGDYVLAGGEVAALTVIEAVSRLLPDTLGNPSSLAEESHNSHRLEYPHYTRPREYRGRSVPPVLLSGNHSRIDDWRMKKSLELTRERRPDLLDSKPLTEDEQKLLDLKS